MKAVIVDRNGNDAVALRDDGQFIKLKNMHYEIGQQITVKPQTIRFPKQAAIAACAALVIFAGSGFGGYAWSNPISYVSLDVNPSIAYSLNEFNRVIAVSGMNDEGVAVVDAMGSSLKNVDITTALTITVEQLSTDAYLDAENTNYMVIGVYSDKDAKADALMNTVDAFCTDTIEVCSVTTVNVSKETKESADSYGITAGKMELINEIASVASDPATVDPAALADLTVAELEQTKEAAASGASVPDAVAAAASPAPDTKPAADSTPDPNAVASDDKKDAAADESKPDASSSDKGDTPVSEPTPTDNNPAENNQSVSADNSSSTSSSPSPDKPDNSTDKTGNGSSDKKDEDTSSDKTDETTSSDKKDEDASSSDKKDETTSSDKKDDATEDSSGQTNSNLDPEPEIVTELTPEMLAKPSPETPADALPETSEDITNGNMLS